MTDATASNSPLTAVIERYKADPESVYNTWFIGSEERMKAFCAIRRGGAYSAEDDRRFRLNVTGDSDRT